GQVRRRGFDAIIGVGGQRPWHRHKGIALKINWVGIHPHETEGPRRSKPRRGPCLRFDCFVLREEDGPELQGIAPHLFSYMFEEDRSRFRRHFMSASLSPEMKNEVATILAWAEAHRDEGSAQGVVLPPLPKALQPRVAGKKPCSAERRR